MTNTSISAPSGFEPEKVLTDLLHRVQSLQLAIEQALADAKGVEYTVPGETTDHLEYRWGRDANGSLSKLGEGVMLALLKLGLSDDEVAKRMSVSPNGVADRRRRWGRRPGQRG